jgi:S-adenosylmethionine synthetase
VARSGKDPWRLDGAAAFRARQIAIAIVDPGFIRDALTFAVALRTAGRAMSSIVAHGRTVGSHDVNRWLRRFDPSAGDVGGIAARAR